MASLLLNNTTPACEVVDVAALVQSDEWVRRGKDEFVSVASFNRFSLDLLRFGAPADLVMAAQRAALEEAGHTKLSFSLATRLAATRLSASQLMPEPKLVVPDNLPLSVSVVEMATHAFKEACVGELVASVMAKIQLQCVASVHKNRCVGSNNRGCMDLKKMVETLQIILSEETGHTALAFETVRWATAQDANALDAVTAALEAILEHNQMDPTIHALLRHIVAPWVAGAPVTKVSDAALGPVQLNAIEGMVRALKLRDTPLRTE